MVKINHDEVKSKIIQRLKDNHWSKELVEQLGEKWVQELHFETRRIRLEVRNGGVAVYIPLPNCNDHWTRESFCLADFLLSEFKGYYAWDLMFLANEKHNYNRRYSHDMKHDLAICLLR